MKTISIPVKVEFYRPNERTAYGLVEEIGQMPLPAGGEIRLFQTVGGVGFELRHPDGRQAVFNLNPLLQSATAGLTTVAADV